MARLKGRSMFADDDSEDNSDDILHVTTHLETDPDGTARIIIGDRHGVIGETGIIESTDRKFRWGIDRYIDEIKATQYRHSPPRTVPKEQSTSTQSGPELPGGVCPRCHGEGEYPWGDGWMKTCPACNGTGRIGEGTDDG